MRSKIKKELEKADQVQVDEFRGRIDAFSCIRDAVRAYTKYRTKLLQCRYPDF